MYFQGFFSISSLVSGTSGTEFLVEVDARPVEGAEVELLDSCDLNSMALLVFEEAFVFNRSIMDEAVFKSCTGRWSSSDMLSRITC
jgi:hypothetical protein